MSRILSQSSLRRQMSEVDKGTSDLQLLLQISFLIKGVTVDSRLPGIQRLYGHAGSKPVITPFEGFPESSVTPLTLK